VWHDEFPAKSLENISPFALAKQKYHQTTPIFFGETEIK